MRGLHGLRGLRWLRMRLRQRAPADKRSTKGYSGYSVTHERMHVLRSTTVLHSPA